jgi:hypothetical protein
MTSKTDCMTISGSTSGVLLGEFLMSEEALMLG